MAECNRDLLASGAQVMPRTCRRCGLGPCSRQAFPVGEPLPPNLQYDVTVLSDTGTFKLGPGEKLGPIPAAPEPDVPGDEAYPWANGDGQILLRSFIFEQLSTPQSTLDFKKEIPAMQAFRTWIMTGIFQEAPSGSKLKVV